MLSELDWFLQVIPISLTKRSTLNWIIYISIQFQHSILNMKLIVSKVVGQYALLTFIWYAISIFKIRALKSENNRYFSTTKSTLDWFIVYMYMRPYVKMRKLILLGGLCFFSSNSHYTKLRIEGVELGCKGTNSLSCSIDLTLHLSPSNNNITKTKKQLVNRYLRNKKR